MCEFNEWLREKKKKKEKELIALKHEGCLIPPFGDESKYNKEMIKDF